MCHNTTKFPALIVGGLAAVLAAGCAGSPCEQAVEHLQSCFAGQSIDTRQALASCDPAQAAQVLDQSCEALSQQGKADGCVWWMPWTCWGGSGGGNDSDTGDLHVSLIRCGDYFGMVDCTVVFGSMPCVLITVEDAAGNEVARDHTGNHGSIAVKDLAAGSYRVRVWRQDGTPAQMVDGDGLAAADTSVEVSTGDEATRAELSFAPGEQDLVNRCSRLEGTLEGSCGGAVLDPEETEWRWLVQLESLDGVTETRTIRPLKTWQEDTQSANNRYYFRGLLPGSYRLVVHEMDIPSYQRRANPDYEKLLRWYTAQQSVFETTVTVAQAPAEIEAPAINVTCQ